MTHHQTTQSWSAQTLPKRIGRPPQVNPPQTGQRRRGIPLRRPPKDPSKRRQFQWCQTISCVAGTSTPRQGGT